MLNYLLLQTGGGPDMGFFLMMIAMFVVIYFFMIRPQSKKAKDQKKFIEEIKKGDRVVTIGGIHGKISRVDDDSFLIDVDANTKLRIEKSVISMEFTKAANARAAAPEKTEKQNGSN